MADQSMCSSCKRMHAGKGELCADCRKGGY